MQVQGLTALVLGSTGLVGGELVKLLEQDERFASIKLFTRRELNRQNPKIEEFVINFDAPDEWIKHVEGDVLFSAFGTTIKKAGSESEQYKIDYTYQLQMAKAASVNKVKSLVLVSAIGADHGSKFFYNRIKGQLDNDVQELQFENICILRPSVLAGDRKEHRFAEKMAVSVFSFIKYLPIIKKFRPIHATTVAKAMINSLLKTEGVRIIKADKIFLLADK